MADVLRTHEEPLVEGTVVARPNRFVLEVEFGDGPERAFLADPGELAFLSPGSRVLCSAVDDPDRTTDHDAIAGRAEDCWVSLRAALANSLFAAALDRDALPAFAGYDVLETEPRLPDHGRSDFVLAPPDGHGVDGGGVDDDRGMHDDGDHTTGAYVEVKSCTHAEHGVGKFPDRPTERGRRHLAGLQSLVEDGVEAHLVFVAQRPDVDVVTPFTAVDPAFAERLRTATEAGVGVHAMAVEFDPPTYRLRTPDLPVRLPDDH